MTWTSFIFAHSLMSAGIQVTFTTWSSEEPNLSRVDLMFSRVWLVSATMPPGTHLREPSNPICPDKMPFAHPYRLRKRKTLHAFGGEIFNFWSVFATHVGPPIATGLKVILFFRGNPTNAEGSRDNNAEIVTKSIRFTGKIASFPAPNVRKFVITVPFLN